MSSNLRVIMTSKKSIEELNDPIDTSAVNDSDDNVDEDKHKEDDENKPKLNPKLTKDQKDNLEDQTELSCRF